MKRLKQIIFLVGSNGSGKDTIAKKVINLVKDSTQVITYTTREKRQREVNGEDKYFVNMEEFEKLKKDLIEYNLYGNNYYGTHPGDILKTMESNTHLVMILEPNGIINFLNWLSNNQDGKYLLNKYDITISIEYIITHKSTRIKRLLNNLNLDKTIDNEVLRDKDATDKVLERLQRENDSIDLYMVNNQSDFIDVKPENVTLVIEEIDNENFSFGSEKSILSIMERSSKINTFNNVIELLNNKNLTIDTLDKVIKK